MLPNFTFERPETLEQAVHIAVAHTGHYSFLGGGTDLISNMKHNLIKPEVVVDLKIIDGLKKLELNNDGLYIGAAVTVTELIEFEGAQKFPPLVEAAKHLGSLQIRNRATVGGNICNASPCANTVTPLVVLGALVDIVGPDGKRTVAMKDFIIGVKKTVLQPGELVVAIRIPKLPDDAKGGFLEKGRVKGPDIGSANVSCLVSRKAKIVRVCYGSLATTPKVLECGEILDRTDIDVAIEEVAEKVKDVINPISDQRSTRQYRMVIAEVYTKRLLKALVQEK